MYFCMAECKTDYTKRRAQVMSDMYIKPKKAFTKIKQANGLTRPVYIFGASGFGKTSLALSFLSKKSYTYISCQSDKWNISGLTEHISSKRITNVVIDDLQYLTNVRCQEELISLIENENVWTVMICRSRLPSWLTGCYFRRSFTLIGESDLCLGTDEAKQLFKETGADILPEKLEEIVLCAPTGKAQMRMKQSLNRQISALQKVGR